jgi:hypothetical protein
MSSKREDHQFYILESYGKLEYDSFAGGTWKMWCSLDGGYFIRYQSIASTYHTVRRLMRNVVKKIEYGK